MIKNQLWSPCFHATLLFMTIQIQKRTNCCNDMKYWNVGNTLQLKVVPWFMWRHDVILYCRQWIFCAKYRKSPGPQKLYLINFCGSQPLPYGQMNTENNKFLREIYLCKLYEPSAGRINLYRINFYCAICYSAKKTLEWINKFYQEIHLTNSQKCRFTIISVEYY